MIAPLHIEPALENGMLNMQMTREAAQTKAAFEQAAELIRTYGSNTLAFFGLSPENRHFLTADGRGLVNYRLMGNVAVAPGDPVCAPEMREEVTRSFLNFCAHHRWRVAFYQASPGYLPVYRAFQMRVFKIGEEAMIDPQTFTLAGSAMANVRTSCRRAEREGVRIAWYEGVPPVAVMQQLEDISSAWLAHKQQSAETGFTMGKLEELIETAQRAEAVTTAGPRYVTGVALTNTGKACAFVTFTPLYAAKFGEENGEQGAGWGCTLDLMRRVPNAPPCVMELLLVSALERFRSQGASVLSLGMVALSDTDQEMTSAERRLISFVLNRLHLLENRSSLFRFKQKFHPCWESRYLVTGSALDLPKIALAVFRLRNYASSGLMKLFAKVIGNSDV
jgi:phosphatidylglycerol lysyltransferase